LSTLELFVLITLQAMGKAEHALRAAAKLARGAYESFNDNFK
jgi:hypothetical protein